MTTTALEPPQAKPLPPLSADTVARLEQAKAFIETNFHGRLTLKEIAAAANLSAFHFHRLFVRHFGRTPKSLVDELRIESAKLMLLDGQPIRDVATYCGFANQSHFTDRFKQLVGMPPGEWLKAERAKHQAK